MKKYEKLKELISSPIDKVYREVYFANSRTTNRRAIVTALKYGAIIPNVSPRERAILEELQEKYRQNKIIETKKSKEKAKEIEARTGRKVLWEEKWDFDYVVFTKDGRRYRFQIYTYNQMNDAFKAGTLRTNFLTARVMGRPDKPNGPCWRYLFELPSPANPELKIDYDDDKTILIVDKAIKVMPLKKYWKFEEEERLGKKKDPKKQKLKQKQQPVMIIG